MEFSSTSISNNTSSHHIRDEGVLDLYLKSLRESLENNLRNDLKEKQNFSLSFKELKENNSVLIKIKIKKFTDENPFDIDICFFMQIDSKFPETAPIITCNTNFCFPSLFDNRNLLTSIIPYSWRSNCKLSDVILAIPKFIDNYTNDIKNKILTYYGECKLNEFYNVNDFLLNPDNLFFKLEIELNTMLSSNREISIVKEWRYFIITEVFLLILGPCQGSCCDKSKARLSFIGELKNIINFKSVKNVGSEGRGKVGIVLEWDKSSDEKSVLDNVILMDYENYKKFVDTIEIRSKALLENFTIFHDDINKLNNTINSVLKINDESTEKLEELIVYKESLLGIEKKNDDQITKDLMTLYQKVIEIYSAKSDETYMIYMKKLQTLLIDIDKNSNQTNSFTLLN